MVLSKTIFPGRSKVVIVLLFQHDQQWPSRDAGSKQSCKVGPRETYHYDSCIYIKGLLQKWLFISAGDSSSYSTAGTFCHGTPCTPALQLITVHMAALSLDKHHIIKGNSTTCSASEGGNSVNKMHPTVTYKKKKTKKKSQASKCHTTRWGKHKAAGNQHITCIFLYLD